MLLQLNVGIIGDVYIGIFIFIFRIVIACHRIFNEILWDVSLSQKLQLFIKVGCTLQELPRSSF
jgi:hypothetical protein